MSHPTSRSPLKTTTSRCPQCQRLCPAEVWQKTAEQDSRQPVYLTRQCPTHGSATSCLARDGRFYWLSQGQRPTPSETLPTACTCHPSGDPATLGHNAQNPRCGQAPVESLSTCLALIEIVDSCHLSCPTCFADSPLGSTGSHLKYHPLSDLQKRIEATLARKGPLELLQLSGGEPTLHPDFFALLDWVAEHPRIDYLLINTNGVRLARDPHFAQQLGQRARRGHLQLYLQYDGESPEAQRLLRGGNLSTLKKKALQVAESEAIPFTLAMTVITQNLSELWHVVQTGLPHRFCRGVAFQPFFGSGRLPGTSATSPRLNTADLILALLGQSHGQLSARDFTPLPCGDPNCATIGYLLRTPLGLRSISEFVDFQKIQGFLRDKICYELADLQQCGCENTELGDLLKRFELKEEHAFRLLIKPFMDAWSWDQDRIDRCCTHVITPEGQLDSFCHYYL